MSSSDVETVDMKLEVVTLAVSDVDRAKAFYQSLGWRLDADIVRGDNFRVVQFTPPHSACSVAFGKGVTTAEPGYASFSDPNGNASLLHEIKTRLPVREWED